MNYNNIVFFIGDDNLYETIFDTPRGLKCKNIETKEVCFFKKTPIYINTTVWSELTLNEIFNHIQLNNDKFNNSPLNNLLTQKALKWYNLLKINKVTIPIQIEETIQEEIVQEIIAQEEPILLEPIQMESIQTEIIEEKPKKKSRKKINP